MKQVNFGALIRSLRLQNYMTQADLAEKVGVTDKAVSKWERGISYPDISLFPKLADILGVTAEDLLRECTDEGQPSRLVQIFGMSHDIRTPLHIILGCADMAETYYNDKQLLMRYLESIRFSAEYLIQAFDAVMQTTYLDADQVTPKKYPSNLFELSEYIRTHAGDKKKPAVPVDLTGKRLLVAEDMELNREIVREILRSTGAEIDFAEDGQVCVDMISEAPAGYYDLILMDLLMPRLDGITATKLIRALPDTKKAAIPIIAMTANVYEKDRQAALYAGMNAFTEKPVDIEKLFDVIRETI